MRDNTRVYVAVIVVGWLLAVMAILSAQGQDIWDVPANGGKAVIPINTQIRYSTQIALPEGEYVVGVDTGDREFWQIAWSDKDAPSNLVYVKPSKPGAKTNLHLLATSGTTYHFALSESTAPPKLLVNVTNDELAAEKVKAAGPRYVPASAFDAIKDDLAQAQKTLDAERVVAEKAIEVERANWPKMLQFVYRIEGDLPVTAAWHDARFTYVKWEGLELPVLLERTVDGKPAMLNFQVLEGTYVTPKTMVIPKVIEHVYVRRGKKQGEIIRKD